jgi:hypothetical protein
MRRPHVYALAVLLLVPLLAQLLGGAAPVAGAAPSTAHTLLVDSSDAAALHTLAQAGGTRLADYGGFSLWRAGERAARTLGSRPTVALRDDFDTIWLRSGAFNTSTAGPAVPALLRQVRAAGPQLWMVQFVGPIQDRWLDQVRAAGARLVSYVPNNAYVVWADDTALQAIERTAAAGTSIRWTGAYHPAYRLAPALLGLSGQAAAGMVDVTVQFYTTSAIGASLSRLRALGGAVYKSEQQVLDFTNITLQLPAGQLAQLAREPDVFNIEPWAAPRKLDEMQNQIIAGNISSSGGKTVPAGPGYLAWLSARGLPTDPNQYPIVDVVDDGVDNGTTTPLHPDFYQLGVRPGTSRVVAINNCTSDPVGDGIGGHGNLNAGVVGGYNNRPSGAPYTDAAGFHYGLGVAPYARIAGTKIFRNSGPFDIVDCGNTDSGLVAASYNVGAAITSDSWGCGPDPSGFGCPGSPYDSTAQAYDALTRDAALTTPGNQQMLHIFAAGNDGPGARTIGTPGTAKNVITVGATENVRENGTPDGCGAASNDNADDITSFSSRGPTADGRIKPDIMAPGSHIAGLASQAPGYVGNGVCDRYHPAGQTLYTWSSGTSHSTPAVAGAAALLHTYYRLNIGGGTPPSPAMLKAFMLNGTRYLAGAGAGGSLPSATQGWGDVYLARAFDTVPKQFFDQTTILGATGATFVRTGQVATNAQPFRVTLAWTDAPGSTIGAAYVNNLDLEVTVGGQTYRGNVFSGASSVTGGVADSRNNVENVFLPAGISGPFSVKVTAANIAGDGVPKNADATDQDFALVIYNGSSTSAGVVRGRVTHTTSATPIAGALVRASSGGNSVGTATADAAGDYQLILPPGTYAMTASAAGYTSQTFSNIAVTNGTTTRDFMLGGGVLRGQVRDSFTPARPIAGATVSNGIYTATTGLDGNYTLLLPPGSHTVSAAKAGYSSQTVAGVNVNDSATTTRNFTLPGGALAGTVTEALSTRPVAGASVTIGATTATTDARGRYAVRAPPGSYNVAVAHAGHVARAFGGVAIANGITNTLNVVLTPSLGYAPTVLSRTLTLGQAIVDTHGLTLTNNTAVALTATLLEPPGGIPWLQETPSTITIPPAASASVQIDWSAEETQPGVYRAIVQLRNSQVPAQLVSIPVTMVVEDVAGFIFSSPDADTSEAGGTASFSIWLDRPPTAPVTIGLRSSDTTEGTVVPASLTFTPDNWSLPQMVAIAGVDDALDDGDQVYTIVTLPAESVDPRFAGLDPLDTTLVNADDDTAGVTIAQHGDVVVAEGGAPGTYTIVLNSQPAANVTISLSGGAQLQPIAALTFTPDRWNIPQIVRVRAVDDERVEGVRIATISHRASSADPHYNGAAAAIPNVVVVVADNDSASAPAPIIYLPLIMR